MAAAPRQGMSWENLVYILDFLGHSNENQVSYLGGEPTLHPEFVRFVRYALDRNFCVTVFTSGIVSKATLALMTGCLSGVPSEKLGFICNLNHPSLSSDAELASIHRFLDAFGRQTKPGYSIYQVDFDLDFMADYVDRFSLRKQLRLGVAHPIVGQANAFIPAADLSAMARRLVGYIPFFQATGMEPKFDCGMPLCLFNETELATFSRLAGGPLRFACEPAIDIGPDLNVWACFPLQAVRKKSLRDFNYLSEVNQFCKQTQVELRADRGVFPACATCVFRAGGACGAGCVAHLMQGQ